MKSAGDRSGDMKSFLTAAAVALLGVTLMVLNNDVEAEGKRPIRSGAKLTSFQTCKGLNRYARAHPRSLRTIGFGGGGAIMEDGVGAPPATGDQALPTAPESTAPTSESGTNVQEAGVDEPDIVKAVGTKLFALSGGALHSIDASGTTPRELDSVQLPGEDSSYYYGYGAELLISGDRALVIANSGYGYGEPVPLSFAPYSSQSTITELDISDPAALRITKTLKLEGSYVSSRLTGSSARVVVSATPQYPALPDGSSGGGFVEGDAVSPPSTGSPEAGGTTQTPASRSRTGTRIKSSGPKWLPTAILTNRATHRRTARPMARCTDISRPESFSGLDTLTVLTIDMDRGLPAVDSDAITTSGQFLYASTSGLYVATENWYDGTESAESVSTVSTEIHKFSAPAEPETEYRASGEVPGYMLSQWSMSEHENILRVASTTSPPWLANGQTEKSQSFVTTLGEASGKKLVQIGQVGGLGTNERIYAVRFIGETGFVVTFRQVDPLYTLDLSDPSAPKVLGELKIPGYSAYLHPVGKGLLLGVGQSATEQGRLLGTQLSMFDVSNLASPSLIEQQTVAPGAHSEIEYDHHAFLFHDATNLAVIPVDVYDPDTGRPSFVGAIGYRVDAAGIEEVGRLTHGGGPDAVVVRRSFVIGDKLITVSDRGVVASDLATLESQGELRF